MNQVHPTPRLLLGCTLLFWGAMCGRPLIGLVAALLIEARYWVRVRWDFNDDACARAWQLSTVLTVMVALLLIVEGNRFTALPELLSWFPILMMPVQFVQSYGLRDGIPLGSISYFARRQRLRAERLGLPIESRMFHFGNVTFFLCMVASTVGGDATSKLFLPGVLALVAWRILATGMSGIRVLLPAILVAGLGSLAGEYGIRKLEERYGWGGGARDGKFDPSYNQTMIGTAGEVTLSPEIKWRLRPVKGPPPKLLRIAGYNRFSRSTWQAPRLPQKDFLNLDSRVVGDEVLYLTARPDPTGSALPVLNYQSVLSLPSFTIRGEVKKDDPLPLPGDAAGVYGIEVDLIESNSFGTIRMTPKEPVIDGTVYWQGGTHPEPPPAENENLKIPDEERETIRTLAQEIGLDENPSDIPATLAKLKTWFHKEFKYSLHLTIRRNRNNEMATPISQFLTTARSGHCEYFATSAALMLRHCGIPARYATGFAVAEYDPERREAVIRGTHGHAWCRVWDGKQWIDFDPTPPNWITTNLPKPSLGQRIADFIQCLREDFFIWRSNPSNQLMITVIMGVIGFGLGSVILVRLWKSRSETKDAKPGVIPGAGAGRTPLHDLESLVRRKSGPRPPGEPFAAWVARAALPCAEATVVEEAVTLHQQLRFDPASAPSGHRERLEQLARILRAALTRKEGAHP